MAILRSPSRARRWISSVGGRCAPGTVILAVSLLALLAACTAPELAPERGLPRDGAHGVVVLSLLRSGVREFPVLFNVRSRDGHYYRVVELRPKGPTLDWPAPSSTLPAPVGAPQGRLAVLVLPAGDYEIFRWQGDSIWGGYYGDGYEIYDQELGLRFSVEPGKLRYLGAIQLALPDKVNAQADIVPDHYRFLLIDHQAEDRIVLERRYPGLATEPMESGLIEYAGPEKRRYYLMNKKLSGDSPIRRRNR